MHQYLSEYLALFEVHEKNRKWFEGSYATLVDKYDREFVAVYEERVVDSDKDLDSLVRRVTAKHPSEMVLIEYVTKEKIQLIL